MRTWSGWSVCISVCLYITCQPVRLSVSMFSILLPTCFRMPVCLPLGSVCYLHACLSVCLPVCMFVFLPVCVFVFLPVFCLSVCMPVFLSVCLLSVCLLVCLPTCLSACLSVCLSQWDSSFAYIFWMRNGQEGPPFCCISSCGMPNKMLALKMAPVLQTRNRFWTITFHRKLSIQARRSSTSRPRFCITANTPNPTFLSQQRHNYMW